MQTVTNGALDGPILFRRATELLDLWSTEAIRAEIDNVRVRIGQDVRLPEEFAFTSAAYEICNRREREAATVKLTEELARAEAAAASIKHEAVKRGSPLELAATNAIDALESLLAAVEERIAFLADQERAQLDELESGRRRLANWATRHGLPVPTLPQDADDASANQAAPRPLETADLVPAKILDSLRDVANFAHWLKSDEVAMSIDVLTTKGSPARTVVDDALLAALMRVQRERDTVMKSRMSPTPAENASQAAPEPEVIPQQTGTVEAESPTYGAGIHISVNMTGDDPAAVEARIRAMIDRALAAGYAR